MPMFRRARVEGALLRARAGVLLAAVSLAAQAHPVPSPIPTARKRAAGLSQTPPSRQLYPAGTTKLSAPGPGAVLGQVQCDANGNVYMNSVPTVQLAREEARFGTTPLTRLALGSGNTTEFQYPSFSEYSSHYDQGFYVTPRGDVYPMAEARPRKSSGAGSNFPVNVIIKYKDDGTVDSIIKLRPPTGVHFLAHKFAAFLDGRVLVTGLRVGGPPPYLPLGPFTGVFDRDGGYIGPLALPNDVTPPKHAPPKPGSL
jgi:hypothetical protein